MMTLFDFLVRDMPQQRVAGASWHSIGGAWALPQLRRNCKTYATTTLGFRLAEARGIYIPLVIYWVGAPGGSSE